MIQAEEKCDENQRIRVRQARVFNTRANSVVCAQLVNETAALGIYTRTWGGFKHWARDGMMCL